ncbi:anthranilate phosphoribosyltransferase [Pontibacter silvestris]|uniref:Anthranilate phosphoribosyltransferase n=1 Tax=Pontibacter silvestris TaxID=2305183 RepID=A0ABW4X1D6_9BACT|nr:anthranilate phosphoribosyltransferase [Pontibacter silvestris]MCC9138306.1 anthranilate phosphoribosyltransferase [Pontibacter silvestris]
MDSAFTLQDNPLLQGIKVIGIGKHGSKPLTDFLLDEIIKYVRSGDVVPIQKGAFYGALMAKGPTEKEQQLLRDGTGASFYHEEQLYDSLCADSPEDMQEIGVKLLRKEFLTVSEAQKLGNYMFSDLPGETFRGMAASMLRIRYESDEEYQGLMAAANLTFKPGFHDTVPVTKSAIQLAEPFDGVEHSYMITPLLAKALQKAGYPVIVSMGRSAGPKLSLNTLDIYRALNGKFLQSNHDLIEEAPLFGWALDQEVLSPALDEWVERRRLIFKRPFLATLEKVLNPCKAKILITSVFHITYMEKMIKLADMAGFSGVIILKRGLEGTLAPSLAKASGILCAARQLDGTYATQAFDADAEAFVAYRAESDDNVVPLHLEDNLRLIQQYTEQGFTGNKDFDNRINLAIALYKAGVEWITENSYF